MTQFSFPFKGTNNAELLDEQLFHALLRNQPSGNWLVSRDGWWHGGVHFTSSSGSEVDMAAGVRCIADGEVVAYRLNKAPLSTTVTDQTGSKAAPYSTGFVLVRHQLASPKPKTPPTPASQRTSASPAPARPAEPPPKPLVFFSLYMHLQSLEEYQTNDARHPSAKQPRPAFWQRVYAVSDSANNRPRQQPGRTPCGASVYKTATPGSRLGILPVGTELLVRGSPRHHLVRIAEILGEAAALPDTWGHAPDPLIAQGWIDQRLLTLVDTPNARSLLDEVVILSEPYPIKAGELVGHLGLYHWHSQPDSVNRMLHLEVFCGDELPGFIQTSRTVAARLPRDSCTILKTGLGAVLWERHTSTVADTQIPANTRLTAPTNDKHTDTAWIQVSAAGQSYWISRQDWGGIQQHGNKTSSNVAAWRSYPDSFKAPVNPLTLTTGVDHYRALSWLEQHKAELGARDQDGNRWWKVHSALRTTTGFTDIEGWVKAVQHPGGNVSSEHPGDWVDFQLEASDEGGTGTLFADRQQFKDYLGNPQGAMGSKDKLAPLFQQLHGFMTRGGDGSSAANDLRQAASSRWIAERLARAIARHDSEWSSNSLAKWKELKRVLQTPENAGLWEQELVRIEKLAWWEQVSGKVKDFPASSKVYHLHPVAMVGNFMTTKQITLAMLKKLWPLASDDNLLKLTIELNKNINDYKIETEMRLAHFFAQIMQETGPYFSLVENFNYNPAGLIGTFGYFKNNKIEAQTYGRTSEHAANQIEIANRAYNGVSGNNELGNGDISSGDGWKYRGRGLKQTTGRYNYDALTTGYPKVWPDDHADFINNPDLLGEIHYGTRAAIFFWLSNKLFETADKTDKINPDKSVDAITSVINKHTKSYQARRDNFKHITDNGIFKDFE